MMLQGSGHPYYGARTSGASAVPKLDEENIKPSSPHMFFAGVNEHHAAKSASRTEENSGETSAARQETGKTAEEQDKARAQNDNADKAKIDNVNVETRPLLRGAKKSTTQTVLSALHESSVEILDKNNFKHPDVNTPIENWSSEQINEMMQRAVASGGIYRYGKSSVSKMGLSFVGQ